jgi:hypothetical protein
MEQKSQNIAPEVQNMQVNDAQKATVHPYVNVYLEWQAPSYIPYNRNLAWYAINGVIVALLVLAGFLIQSATFAIVVIVFAMVYLLVGQKDPKTLDVLVSDVGIKFGSRKIQYSEIKTYWIEYAPPYYQILHLVPQKKFEPEISISFHGINPSNLREILTKYLPEWEEKQKTITEHITRILGL